MSKNQVNLLLSGGIDSTAALSYYKEQRFEAKAYFVHYGHPANDVEYKHAKSISQHYNTSLIQLKFIGSSYEKKSEIKGRNAFLILAVLMANQSYSGIISAGIHEGSLYYDCNEEFIVTMKDLFNGYTGGTVQLDFPLIKMTKAEIVAYCNSHNVPIDNTYSCERGADDPCWKCSSCLERSEAIKYADNNLRRVR